MKRICLYHEGGETWELLEFPGRGFYRRPLLDKTRITRVDVGSLEEALNQITLPIWHIKWEDKTSWYPIKRRLDR